MQSIILEFIDNFRTNRGKFNDDSTGTIISLFRGGYCYYFAHLLQIAFNSGTVCWAAPFGHFVWVNNDIPYDIEGIYEGEAFYLIPETYIEDYVHEFKHIPSDKRSSKISTKEILIERIKDYCKNTNQVYDSDIEKYF